MNRETAERSTILRGLVGSTVHGLNVNDGIEDRDEMGICVESLEEAMSLRDPFEQFIYRTAAEREGRDDARRVAGDLDLTIYSLRRASGEKVSEQEGLIRADELERALTGPGLDELPAAGHWSGKDWWRPSTFPLTHQRPPT